MIRKMPLAVVLLLMLAATCGAAPQVQILIGVFGYFPVIEATVLSPPTACAGYQQEVGLRLTWMLFGHIFDLVLRSWWSFPQSDSDFLQDRLRCAVEYSPTLRARWENTKPGWLPLAFRPGVGAAFRVDDPSTPISTEVLLFALSYLELYPPRGSLGSSWPIPTAGLAFRWYDL